MSSYPEEHARRVCAQRFEKMFLAPQIEQPVRYCSICGAGPFTTNELWAHAEEFHFTVEDYAPRAECSYCGSVTDACPVCGRTSWLVPQEKQPAPLVECVNRRNGKCRPSASIVTGKTVAVGCRCLAYAPQPAPCHMCGGAKVIPADDGEGLQTCKCCKGTGIKPNFTGVNTQPAPLVFGWEIDTSTGVEILMFEKCSVIESEQARLVMDALKAHAALSDLQAQLAVKDEELVGLRGLLESKIEMESKAWTEAARTAEELAAKERECEELRGRVKGKAGKCVFEYIDALKTRAESAESSRDGYKARCEALRPALERMVAIGYTHESGCHPSEGKHTAGCREKKAALEQARTALAATEVK